MYRLVFDMPVRAETKAMTLTALPSVGVRPAFIKGRNADGFYEKNSVVLKPQVRGAEIPSRNLKKCSWCNRPAMWLFTLGNPSYSTKLMKFWRCNICLTEEEIDIIRHTYYTLSKTVNTVGLSKGV